MIDFAVSDICQDSLPDFELLTVRDFLLHLSYSDINSFLKNFHGVNYRYLLTTTHSERNILNRDIVTVDYRKIDLFSAPFDLSKACVVERVNHYPPGYVAPHEMILIEKDKVPTSVS